MNKSVRQQLIEYYGFLADLLEDNLEAEEYFHATNIRKQIDKITQALVYRDEQHSTMLLNELKDCYEQQLYTYVVLKRVLYASLTNVAGDNS